MRQWVCAVCAVFVVAAPGPAAAARLPTGWWESTQIDPSDGQATSFELRRASGGRYQIRHLLAWSPGCGSGVFGDDRRILVDRRGRFRARGDGGVIGPTAVRGRLSGWRRDQATIRFYWNELGLVLGGECRMGYSFTMHPQQRLPVQSGRWQGTDVGGRPVEFSVGWNGRYLLDFSDATRDSSPVL